MGMRLSRPQAKTPYDALGIGKLCTLEETKRAYCRMFYHSKKDQEKMRELNEAYDFCRSNLDVDLYHDLFQQVSDGGKPSKSVCVVKKDGKLFVEHLGWTVPFDFSMISSDFFERLSLRFGLKCPPKFLDPDFVGFYSFWTRFAHTDKGLERKVRRIVRMIRDSDPRIAPERVYPSFGGSAVVQCTRKASKQEKVWKNYCDACRKGFNSDNTLRDHLNSRQHRRNTGVPDSTDSCSPAVSASTPGTDTIPEVLEEKEELPCENKPEFSVSEHPLLRTCHACKKVLRTRGELILHMRTKHL